MFLNSYTLHLTLAMNYTYIVAVNQKASTRNAVYQPCKTTHQPFVSSATNMGRNQMGTPYHVPQTIQLAHQNQKHFKHQNLNTNLPQADTQNKVSTSDQARYDQT